MTSPVRWRETVAVFGGTFDPPHLGHREAVRGLFKDPGVKQVLVLPSALPPQKTSFATAEQRLEMARMTFSGSFADPFPAEVSVDPRELERAGATGRPSYTYETLERLRPELGNVAFVIGVDQLKTLPTWYRFPEVLGLAHWIVLERKPAGKLIAEQVIAEWLGSGLLRTLGGEKNLWGIRDARTCLKVVETSAPELSSTWIREEIARTGQPPEGTLLPDVVSYLKRSRLYGTQ